MPDADVRPISPSQASPSPPGDGRDWTVALVHGIGNTEPISLISDVVKSLQAARPALRIDNETMVIDKARLGLAERLSKEEKEKEFVDRPLEPPQTARIGHIGEGPAGPEVRFATAFWSDISFSKEGLLNLLGGMLLSGFGVRYLADVAAHHRSFYVKLIRNLLKGMVKVLALFVFPITLFSLIFSTMALLAFYAIKDPSPGAHLAPRNQALFIAGSSIVISLLVARFGLRSAWPLRRERTLLIPIFSAFIAYAVVFSGLLLALMLLDDGDRLRRGLEHVIGTLGQPFDQGAWSQRVRVLDKIGLCVGLLQWLQLWGGITMIVLTSLVVTLIAPYYLLRRGTPARRRSLVIAAISVISLWILIMLMFWPENLVTYAAMTAYWEQEATNKIKVIVLDTKAWTFEWKEYGKLGHSSYLMLWFEIVFLALVAALAVVAAALISARKVWIACRAGATFASLAAKPVRLGHTWPRLIAPAAYVCTVVFFMLLISAIALIRLINDDELVLETIGLGGHIWRLPEPLAPGGARNLAYEIAMPGDIVRIGAVAAVVFFALVAHWVHSAMKLILDVCNHFTAPSQGFPVRSRIEKRLQDAFTFLLRGVEARRSKAPPHMLVVAHSQGTVIAFDELFGDLQRKGSWIEGSDGEPALGDRVESLTILTFGSPLTHVYQHYFAHHYPTFADKDPAGPSGDAWVADWRKRLAAIARDPRVRWVNAYRIDDYVGTYVDDSLEGFPVNIPLPVGGHIQYWDAKVFTYLFDRPELAHVLIGAPKPVSTGGGTVATPAARPRSQA